MFWFPKVLRSHFSFVPLKAFLLLIQADDSSFEKLNFFSIGRVFPQKRKAKSKSTNYRENFIVLGPKNSLFIGESRIGEKSSSGNGNRCREKNVQTKLRNPKQWSVPSLRLTEAVWTEKREKECTEWKGEVTLQKKRER